MIFEVIVCWIFVEQKLPYTCYLKLSMGLALELLFPSVAFLCVVYVSTRKGGDSFVKLKWGGGLTVDVSYHINLS